MDVVGAVGIAFGLAGVVITIAFGVSQTSSARIGQEQLGNYLYDFHGQMLSRFDRIDETLNALLAQREQNRNA